MSEWADAYAFLSPESSAQPGKWKTIPYQKGIMDAMTDPEIERITIMKSARVGYTKMINHLIGYHIHQDPCPMLIVQPTIEDAQGYSKDEIAPMLRDTEILVPLSPDAKTRDSNNTILRKQFPAMTLMMTGANSARGFRRISARIIVFDEVDGYPPTAGQEGDQITLGSRRADFYWNKKIVLGSTPTIKGISRIEESFEQSDRRRYHVPCPHCGFMQVLEWSNIDFTTHGTIKKPVYICADCQKAIEYQKHRWMIERGAWIAEGEFSGHAGFHVWAAYSYSPNATWHHIVKEFLAAKDNREKLKTWVNTVVGETWEEQGDQLDPNDIKNRREDYGVIMPMDSAVLTAQVDVQGDRLEVLVKAWGRDEESWGLEHIVIFSNPALPGTWEKLDAIRLTPYPHMNGTHKTIDCMFIDSGGHHTDYVYAYVKVHAKENVYAIKGSRDIMAPIISRPRRSRRSKSYKMAIDLISVGVHTAKDLVSSRLQVKEPGPGYIHYPLRFGDDFFDQLTAEKKVLRVVRGARRYEWVKVKPRNEAWDLEVYGVAALRKICADVVILNREVDKMQNIEAPEKKMKVKAPGRGFVMGWKS